METTPRYMITYNDDIACRFEEMGINWIFSQKTNIGIMRCYKFDSMIASRFDKNDFDEGIILTDKLPVMTF